MKNIARLICILSLGGFLSAERNADAQSYTFNYTGSVQTWTVPCGVTQITISATGGGGGGSVDEDMVGGAGATIVGSVSVASGDVIDIYTGGEGTENPDDDGGAGGGGSFIYDATSSTLLEVAGGGGGAEWISNNGYAASTTTTPTGSNPGAGEGGGGATTYDAGGAGAGFLANGGADCSNCYAGEGGNDWSNGFAGGAGDFDDDPTIVGGYGGGGGAGGDGGGGGGGYNGGGSAGLGGGGGGSYVNGTMISGTTTNAGNGTVTITIPANALIATMGPITDPMCDGGTGTATVNVSGGVTPYTYTWAPTGGTNATGTGLTAGSYTVTVQDNAGCSSTASATITQPNPLAVTASTIKNVACNGGSTGSAGSSVSGGTTPYTYAWTPSGGTNSTASGLTAGSYTVTVMDACGSSASASTSISQPNPIGIGAVVTANETCNGGSNGSALAFAYSGTPAYTYSWAPSGGSTDSAVGLTAGNYTVTAMDSCGQTATVQVVINQPGPIIVSLAATANSICRGDYNGSASSSISGGTAPYNYSWTGGAGTRDTAVGLTAGTYTLSVVDVNGCTGSSSVTITEPNVLAVAGGVTTDVSCNGGSNGSAMATPSGGTMPYTYTWYPAGGNSSSATGLSAGTYTITVNDVCGGRATASVTITQTNAIVVMTGTTANVLCNGGSDGSASSSTTGGTMPYMYSWSGGSTTDTATGLSAGSYTLTVTDMNGCTGSVTGVITQPTALNVVKNSVPDNGKCTGSAWVTVSGGVSPYSYLWGNGSTTYNITGQCKGTYCCTVTDANGCKDSVCIDISSDLGIAGINSGGGAINVYPNPNNGQFTIQSSVISGQSTVEIYNMLGEKVYSTNFNGGTNTINIGNQPNGVYLYRAITQTGDLLGEGKIIIQK